MCNKIYYCMLYVKRENAKKMTMLEAMEKLNSTDFRMKGKTRFSVSTIAVITHCAMIGGANGIPNHDTFRYFWRNLEPARFNACFMEWVNSVSELADVDTVNIDGKVLRRAPCQKHDRRNQL